jgi:bisphosphoglycerate-independent phosphoglycerate mutase (AlkP superfamily)
LIALAIQLGRESISSSVTAILELVKNAYDADATKLSIRFIDAGRQTDPHMMLEFIQTSERIDALLG